jgi:RNA polymerase sigma-70 factor (ECF subfamily)
MTGTDSDDSARRARFAHLFALVYEPLQRYVRRRGGGPDTDDIVAEVLTVLWRRLDDVPGEAEVAWSFGVARRCMANQRRAGARREALEQRIASNLLTPATSDEQLDAALAQLNPDQRELLRLWAWDGLAPREIAVVLGISANAASIRLHRAKRELADLLEARKINAPTGHIGHVGHPTKET